MATIKVISFTGHRPKYWGTYDESTPSIVALKDRLWNVIEAAIVHCETEEFISGMALGLDTWAAEIVLALQQKYPHIRLVAAVPFVGQENAWPFESRSRYNLILARASRVEVTSSLKTVLGQKAPYDAVRKALLDRNVWMNTQTEGVIAVYDPAVKSGTAHCVQSALELGKPVCAIHPSTLKVTRLTKIEEVVGCNARAELVTEPW